MTPLDLYGSLLHYPFMFMEGIWLLLAIYQFSIEFVSSKPVSFGNPFIMNCYDSPRKINAAVALLVIPILSVCISTAVIVIAGILCGFLSLMLMIVKHYPYLIIGIAGFLGTLCLIRLALKLKEKEN